MTVLDTKTTTTTPATVTTTTTTTTTIIPARHGVAVRLRSAQIIRVVNTYGTQVVDTWAFTTSPGSASHSHSPAPSPLRAIILTQLSMQHTRASLERICPRVGDGLYSNERRKMLTVVEEDMGGECEGGDGDGRGVHDTLIAACDKWRYEELGAEEGHRNCADNLVEALEEIGIEAPQFTPSPLNLFMNIPIHDDLKSLSFEAPICKKGKSVSLRAEVDLVIAFSACPQDILKINGGEPKDAHFQIL